MLHSATQLGVCLCFFSCNMCEIRSCHQASLSLLRGSSSRPVSVFDPPPTTDRGFCRYAKSVLTWRLLARNLSGKTADCLTRCRGSGCAKRGKKKKRHQYSHGRPRSTLSPRHAGEGCSWLTAVRAALVPASGCFAKTTLLAATAEPAEGLGIAPGGMNWVRRHETSCK